MDLTLHVDLERVKEQGVAPDTEMVEVIRKRCSGEGVDVAFEMSGSNQALNTAIAATRRGGDIILFGISTGDFTLTDFQNIIMQGKTLHSIVGRKVFQTWYIMSNLLQAKSHQLQDKIYDVILNRGQGTIVPFDKFDRDVFNRIVQQHPKVIFKF